MWTSGTSSGTWLSAQSKSGLAPGFVVSFWFFWAHPDFPRVQFGYGVSQTTCKSDEGVPLEAMSPVDCRTWTAMTAVAIFTTGLCEVLEVLKNQLQVSSTAPVLLQLRVHRCILNQESVLVSGHCPTLHKPLSRES